MATRLPLKAGAVVLLCALLGGGCVDSSRPTPTPATSIAVVAPSPVSATSPRPSASTSRTQDPCDVGEDELPVLAVCQANFGGDAPTGQIAKYRIPATGWHAFNGAYKDMEAGDGIMRVGAGFVTITNVTVDACTDQRAADPPVGPGVDELAEALAALPPFEVTAPPSDVTAFGYPGMHVQIRVPLDQPSTGFEQFTGCGDHLLKTWIAPGHVSSAFNGYTSPGDTEDFWILDVAGERLVVGALTSANATPELVQERQAVLDSVVIVP